MNIPFSITRPVLVAMAGIVLTVGDQSGARSQGQTERPVVVDDFEAYEAGSPPGRWKYLSHSQRRYLSLDGVMDEAENFYVRQEGANKFLRGYTRDEALRITLPNDRGDYNWDLREHPILHWDWRAMHLPEGANEREKNDAGAAVYVTYSMDWLGRPKSIKYTYSSTLPVGTVVDFGRLKVIVASSGRDGIGAWVTVERDVVADYQSVFGGHPPDEPRMITLWSDSDNTNDVAEVDIDNIMLFPLRP